MPIARRRAGKHLETETVTTTVENYSDDNSDDGDNSGTGTETLVVPSPSVLPSPSFPNPSHVRRSPDARGRECIGIAPEVSRTKLSKATGCHKSQVSNVLAGRTEASSKLIRLLAPWIGVTEAGLEKKLKMQRAVYLASELGELERDRRGRGGPIK